jgi:hypothetical protein
MVYIETLAVAQSAQRRIMGLLMNNEIANDTEGSGSSII